MACDCIRHVNDGLAEMNLHLAIAVVAPGSPPRAVVELHRHGPSKLKDFQMAANHCPFCGEAYSDDPRRGSPSDEAPTHVH